MKINLFQLQSQTSIAQFLKQVVELSALGKQSYVSFPAGPEGPAEILIMDADLLWQIQFLIGKSIIRAEELDQYITCTMTDEVKSVAIANARNLCRAALTELQENTTEEVESD